MPDRDEFYVGYLPEAPEGVARHVRRWTILVLALGLVAAATLAALQKPFAVSFFDFGAPRTYEGVVELSPHPLLRVERPGRSVGIPGSTYYLVGFGKHGAEGDVADFAGRRVRLEATPVYRDDQTMLEVVSGTVEAAGEGRPGGEAGAVRTASLGTHTLVGEIVDSKCHLGVMKPGERKAHRACATLCIRGGVPPILVLRSRPAGEVGSVTDHLLLVGSDGRALSQEVLDWVAEPVRITGEIVRMDDLFVLRAEPKTFERIE